MRVAQELKAELRRLVLAEADVRYAARLIDATATTLSKETRWARWEAGLVAYARPFKYSRLRLPEEWSQFPNLDDQLIHDRLIVWRDKLFAHTDPSLERRVILVPPFGAREERQFSVFQDRRTVTSAKRVCGDVLHRLTRRIEAVADELTHGQGWPEGVEVPLESIDDKLPLIPRESPFKIPARAVEGDAEPEWREP